MQSTTIYTPGVMGMISTALENCHAIANSVFSQLTFFFGGIKEMTGFLDFSVELLKEIYFAW
jgi:hypothetical protein